MPAKEKRLGSIHMDIIEILKNNPEGQDIYEVREKLPDDMREGQEQLDRRIRELYPHFHIKRRRKGKMTVYQYIGPRTSGWQFAEVSKDQRARILHKAGGRCQMCGKTVQEDQIKFHIDHKIPTTWGGKTEDENLWAICSDCNEGKKNYFASFDPALMKQIMKHKSVHRRIAELLRAKMGEWVDCDLIEFVANASDSQTDWRKRLRELRYFGLVIETSKEKRLKRVVSRYRLARWVDIPDDLTRAARKYEKERAERNRIIG